MPHERTGHSPCQKVRKPVLRASGKRASPLLPTRDIACPSAWMWRSIEDARRMALIANVIYLPPG